MPGYAPGRRFLIGTAGYLSRHEPREASSGSGAGGHVGGQDVVGVAVQVLAGPVLPHGGAGSRDGGDLDIPG